MVEYKLPFKVAVGWGIGTLAMSVLFNATNFLLLRYLTDFLAVSAVLAGSLIAFSKLYDAFTDPIMGVITDKTRTRWGRRRPYLLLGGALCAMTFVLLFNIPVFESAQTTTTYLIVLLLLYATAYTVFNVPYLAMPAEMTTDYHERSYLMSYRVAAITVGTFTAGAAGPFLISAFGGGVEGHAGMAWVLGSIILGASVTCFLLTGDARRTETTIKRDDLSFLDKARLAATNRPFMLLLLIKLFLLLGVAVNSGTLIFLTVRILEVPDAMLGLLVLVMNGATLISMPFWLRISKRYGKKTAYIVSAVVYALASLSWLFATSEEPAELYLLRSLIKGFGSGGILLVGQSLLPDTIEYDYLRSGLRREGVFAGFYTTVEKLAFAIGASLTGIILGAMGYVSGVEGAAIEQPPSAITAIYICVAVIPAVTIAISVIFVWLYDLSDNRLKEMRSTFTERTGLPYGENPTPA